MVKYKFLIVESKGFNVTLNPQHISAIYLTKEDSCWLLTIHTLARSFKLIYWSNEDLMKAYEQLMLDIAST